MNIREQIEEILDNSMTKDYIWTGQDERLVTEFDKEAAITKLIELFANHKNYPYTEYQVRMHSQNCFCQVHDCPHCMEIAKSQRDNPEVWRME